MKFFKTEWHQASAKYIYDIPDKEIIETFKSIKRFKEIISHQEKKSFGGLEPQGEKPSAEEFDKFDEFIQEFGHSDRNDDWWMERKGGYEVTFEYEGESEDQKK